MSLIRTIATPVDEGAKFQNVVHADAGARYRPFGQLLDLSLLGWDASELKIVHSTDDGATWSTYCDFVFPAGFGAGPAYLAHLPSGEVAVACNRSTDANGGSVWISSGWATPATATFTRTLQLADGLDFSYGGFSAVGDVLLASEYGAQTSAAASAGTEGARRAYLSRDGGQTWTQVFDLSTVTVEGESAPWGTADRVQHVHGCSYDHIWDRLWLAIGDATAGAVCAIIYSDDDGQSWHSVPNSVSTLGHWQSLAPYATDAAILFGSDFDANGIRRIGRTGYRTIGAYESGHVADPGSGIRIIAFGAYRAPGLAHAPILYSFAGVAADYPGLVVGVFDGGRSIRTLYKDTNVTAGAANYTGVYRCIGPTNTGKFVTMLSDTTRFPNGSRMVADLI